MTTTITVCRTCRQDRSNPDPFRDGYRLLHAVDAAARGVADIDVRAQKCVGACDFACAVAIDAPDKIGYVLSELDPDSAAADIVAFALTHAAKPDGVIPKPERPEALASSIHSRIVPVGLDHPMVEAVGDFTPEVD